MSKDPYEIMWTSEVSLTSNRGGYGSPFAVRYTHLGPAEAKIDGQGHLHLQTVAGADFEIEFALHLAGTFSAWAQTPDEQFGVDEPDEEPEDEEPTDISYEGGATSTDELRRALLGDSPLANPHLNPQDEPEGSEFGD